MYYTRQTRETGCKVQDEGLSLGKQKCREQSKLGKKDDGLNLDTPNWAFGSMHKVILKRDDRESKMELESDVRAENRNPGVSQVETMVESRTDAKLRGTVWGNSSS